MWRIRLYLKNFLPGIYILSLIVFLICSMNTSVYSQINPEISALLSQQQKLWNKGDIPDSWNFTKKTTTPVLCHPKASIMDGIKFWTDIRWLTRTRKAWGTLNSKSLSLKLLVKATTSFWVNTSCDMTMTKLQDISVLYGSVIKTSGASFLTTPVQALRRIKKYGLYY